MNILCHDENSLTNLLFCEVHRHGKIAELLRRIRWRNHDNPPFETFTAEVHQQVGLSEFGKPDVIISVEDPSRARHIVIIEGKLGQYIDSAGRNLAGGFFNNCFNSRINNQLALRYRAMRCLGRMVADGFLKELPHVPISPYAADRSRRCMKKKTIQLFRQMLLPAQPSIYLIALTTDKGNLFRDTVQFGHEHSPLFFNQETGQREDFNNLGSLSWDDCNHVFADRPENLFTLSYRAMALHEPHCSLLSDERLDRRQRHLVEYHGEVAHLSCVPPSYAIRIWRGNAFEEVDRGSKDRAKYESLRDRVRVIRDAPSINIADARGWLEYFRNNPIILG